MKKILFLFILLLLFSVSTFLFADEKSIEPKVFTNIVEEDFYKDEDGVWRNKPKSSSANMQDIPFEISQYIMESALDGFNATVGKQVQGIFERRANEAQYRYNLSVMEQRHREFLERQREKEEYERNRLKDIDQYERFVRPYDSE